MITGFIVNVLEKTGSISFDSQDEKVAFIKIAQGEVQQAMAPQMDPNMMAQMQGQAAPQGAIAPQMPIDPQAQQAQQAPAAPMMGPAPSQEETIVGTSITNSDLESLIKIINVLTSLKGRYDQLKSEQMQALKDMGQVNQ